MGAEGFTNTCWDIASVSGAYHHLCDEAIHTYGNDGYNGTISTTSGYSQVLRSPMTESGAELVSEWADGISCCGRGRSGGREAFIAHKWESALAIPIRSDEAFTFRKATFTLSADDLEASEREPSGLQWAFRRVALDHAISEYGFTPHGLTVDVKQMVTPVLTNTQGRTQLVYEINSGWSSKRFTTKTEAVRYARKVAVETGRTVSARIVKVYGDLERPDYAAFTVTPELTKAAAKVTVTLATPKTRVPKGTKQGWFFYGLAAS